MQELRCSSKVAQAGAKHTHTHFALMAYMVYEMPACEIRFISYKTQERAPGHHNNISKFNIIGAWGTMDSCFTTSRVRVWWVVTVCWNVFGILIEFDLIEPAKTSRVEILICSSVRNPDVRYFTYCRSLRPLRQAITYKAIWKPQNPVEWWFNRPLPCSPATPKNTKAPVSGECQRLLWQWGG